MRARILELVLKNNPLEKLRPCGAVAKVCFGLAARKRPTRRPSDYTRLLGKENQ
jgi:hypothetical protein